MRPKVRRTEINVTRTMATVLVGLLVALALSALPSAGAHPPREGSVGQGEVTVASTVPTMISYQGQLLDGSGNPVPNGTYPMTFRLYYAATGDLSSAFWTGYPNVQVTDGLFNVLLGPLDPSKFTGTTYLGVQVMVDGEPEMTPRQQIVSVGYAFRAAIADQVATPQADGDWNYTDNQPNMYSIPTGNVGIGTTTPDAKLEVIETNKAGLRVKPENNAVVLAYGRGGFTHYNLRLYQDKSGFASGVTVGETYLGETPPSNGMIIQGNSGIGTTNPGEKLDVRGTFFAGESAVSGVGISIEGTTIKPANVPGNPDRIFSDLHLDSMYGAGNGHVILAESGGNVGIGTTSPGDKLEVLDTLAGGGGLTTGQLKLGKFSDGSATPARIQHYASNAYIGLGMDNEMCMMGGNVGIGTMDPFNLGKLTIEQGWNDWISLRASQNNNIWRIHNSSEGNRLEIGWKDGASGAEKWGLFVIKDDGNVGIGTTAPDAKLTIKAEENQSGPTVILRGYVENDEVVTIGKGLDYSEAFPTSQNEITPGTVMVIDPVNKGFLTISTQAYDKKVAGIVAGANGLGSGVKLGTSANGDHAVALAGRVYCNVDTQYGDIQPGDLLTTSPTPGHAMVVKDFSKAQGAILGKAMEGLSGGGKGQILVLVTLQ